jgi:hypothetical protein
MVNFFTYCIIFLIRFDRCVSGCVSSIYPPPPQVADYQTVSLFGFYCPNFIQIFTKERLFFRCRFGVPMFGILFFTPLKI